MDKIVHRKKRFIVLKQASATSLAVIQRAKFFTAVPIYYCDPSYA